MWHGTILINHCVYGGKPFVISCGKELFWNVCKLHSVYCFIKKILG